jgi:ABC-2 type transport system permease protein
VVTFSEKSWWIILFPPAWFAGFDDAMAGSMKPGSWVLAAMAIAAPLIVLSIAIGKLARDYGAGLQRLAEVPTGPQRRRRWLDRLVNLPLMRWWLRDPVERASFLLCGAYLARDRDVKLRIYPAMAPILMMPLIFMSQSFMRDQNSGVAEIFGIVMTSCFLGLVPWMALDLLQYSQQWQASDLFRAAPLVGPAPLFHGARRAVLCLLTFPLLALVAGLVGVFDHDRSHLLLLIPGAIVLPIYALAPGLGGKAVPLSLPTEEAKSTGRAMAMIVGIIISMGLAGLTAWAWSAGWFFWLVVAELIVAVSAYAIMRRSLNRVRWPSIE